jgi:hypothetical protein
MATIRQACLCLLLATLCASASAAQDKTFPGVEKLMTSEEFAEAGLGKLTQAERKALNAWLVRYAAQQTPAPTADAPEQKAGAPEQKADAPEQTASAPVQTSVPAAAPVDDFTREKKKPKFEPFTSKIDGSFTGWAGKTVFNLQNGQVWQQRQSGKYFYPADNPEVEIHQNWAGYYRLKLLATGRSVPVKRIR